MWTTLKPIQLFFPSLNSRLRFLLMLLVSNFHSQQQSKEPATRTKKQSTTNQEQTIFSLELTGTYRLHGAYASGTLRWFGFDMGERSQVSRGFSFSFSPVSNIILPSIDLRQPHHIRYSLESSKQSKILMLCLISFLKSVLWLNGVPRAACTTHSANWKPEVDLVYMYADSR